MAVPTHYVDVKVEIKYTVTAVKDLAKPYKESRNQWTDIVKTEVGEPITQEDFVMMKHAILGTIEA